MRTSAQFSSVIAIGAICGALPAVLAMPVGPQSKKLKVKVEKPSPVAQRAASAPSQPPTETQVLCGTEARIRTEFCDCIAISCVATSEDLVGEDVATVKAYNELPGRYFKIGEYCGRSCFRQEKAQSEDDENDKQLFLFYCDKDVQEPGWWIASAMAGASSHKKKGEDKLFVAWCSGKKEFPDTWSVPFWAKKPSKWLLVEPQHSWADQAMTEMQIDNEQLKLEVEQLQLALEEKELALEAFDVMQLEEAESKQIEAEKKKASQLERTKSGGGGWQNRAVPLMVAVQDNNWERAYELVELYAKIPGIAGLMEKEQRRVANESTQ